MLKLNEYQCQKSIEHKQDFTYLQHCSSFPTWPATISAHFKGHKIKCHCPVTAMPTLEKSLECIHNFECVWFRLAQLWRTKGCILALEIKLTGKACRNKTT